MEGDVMKYPQTRTSRKQRAIENTYTKYGLHKPKQQVDTREDIELSQVPNSIRWYEMTWFYNDYDKKPDIRALFNRDYKNGGEMYDLYMEIQNSPLTKALE